MNQLLTGTDAGNSSSKVILNQLLTGIDAGNISTKVTFLNEDGDIEHFAIPTVIAPAEQSSVSYNQQVDTQDGKAIEDFIHIRVNSKAMDIDQNNKAWYVGESAKNSPDKEQPSTDANGDAEDKFTDGNRKVFVLPVLAGMAISALKSGQKNVVAPLSIGIPSKGYLKHEQILKQRFIGVHVVTFIDGPFSNESVTITITEEDAQIHAESVTTAVALKYDIEKGELMQTDLLEKLEGKTFTIADLGAGTSDYAVFNENGLDKVMTRHFAEENDGELSRIGTNNYIDRIMTAVYENPAFEAHRKTIEKIKDVKRKPAELSSREIFMKKIVKPVVDEALKTNKKPKFTYSWARAKDVDITECILKEMKAYAEEQSTNIEAAWIEANTDYIVAVGGGVLFGYFGGLKELEEKDVIVPNLVDSQYFTSKAYLIVSFLAMKVKEEATS